MIVLTEFENISDNMSSTCTVTNTFSDREEPSGRKSFTNS